jgi:hypothetical protein
MKDKGLNDVRRDERADQQAYFAQHMDYRDWTTRQNLNVRISVLLNIPRKCSTHNLHIVITSIVYAVQHFV